ncbi:SEFIR domain-containing protein [Rhodococcus sp. SORGH_AS_0301]|uniref:SEFIR domain-containing protein n=1 Tax=Rhodococcus sp. SORGH_AS_0301 TaxID=3041780 RepID=UPI002787264F|nr:SEFIR domain-containing protein [Rhodococcus sp. SORGH_AS_0301]MDQ1178553.1 hypothetical protein [Rhodococcus sp. SORGH_AS_0301]
MSTSQSPTVFITWAHADTDWDPDQVRVWRQQVRRFATVLMQDCGIETEIDLWNPAADWTRWGPQQIRDHDYVVALTSVAWRERFEGENTPTVGAGAVAECNELLGIFARDQSEFRRRVLLVQLPGVGADTIPGQLHGIARFPLNSIDKTALEPLVRYMTGQPLYLRPTRGPALLLPPEDLDQPTGQATPSTPLAADVAGPATPAAQSVYESLGREMYLKRSQDVSHSRLRLRRRGVGLDEDEVERTLAFRAGVPVALTELAAGELRMLTAPLGSGKSDVAEEWHRANIERASSDPLKPIPVWFSVDDIADSVERAIVDEVGRTALSRLGVDLVIDGLDERTDRAADVMRRASEFLVRWPLSRLVLTSRATLAARDTEVVTLEPLAVARGAELASVVADRPLRAIGMDRTLLGRPFFALLIGKYIDADGGEAGAAELIDMVVSKVVESDSFNLYAELKRLAVETIRRGGPVDPVSFTTEAAAAQMRKSPMVTVFGRACAFSLATFEQWFASKALLEGEVDVTDLLDSLSTFDRWKYVFANVLAAGDPERVDPIMATLAAWNPGAAAWVVRETRESGLARPRPVLDPADWKRIGERLRYATAAWLEGLGPFAAAFCMTAMGAAQTFDDTTIEVNVDRGRLRVAWVGPSQLPGDPLPPGRQRDTDGPRRGDQPFVRFAHRSATYWGELGLAAGSGVPGERP